MPGSAEHLRTGQQLYAVIEFCSNPKTLWGKMESGQWDWLGIVERKGSRRFVVGRPRVGRVRASAAPTVTDAGADGSHRVTVKSPDTPGEAARVCATAEQAAQEFDDWIHRIEQSTEGSALARVRLFTDGRLQREEFVVRAIPNVI